MPLLTSNANTEKHPVASPVLNALNRIFNYSWGMSIIFFRMKKQSLRAGKRFAKIRRQVRNSAPQAVPLTPRTLLSCHVARPAAILLCFGPPSCFLGSGILI